MHTLTTLTQGAVALLTQLIAIPSFSKQEDGTARCLAAFLTGHGVPFTRLKHNLWAVNRHFDPLKPTILLNSHHDTVRPNASYTLDPFNPLQRDGRLYGLGSNDAGGCLVSLLSVFLHYYDTPGLSHNLVLAVTAEEEISGRDGLELVIPHLPPVSFAIVGEPTLMQMAIAEKGLLVVDCTARGRAGHAARDEGENAIYKALQDIEWIRNYQFPDVSDLLGPVKMTVTVIGAGSQHNVVPDACTFTIDVRTTDKYSNEDVLAVLQTHLQSEVHARSVRLRPSSIAVDHAIVQAGKALNLSTYGSPTTSDQALLDVPSLKMGPGDSARSHSADEFIYLDEIEEGIATYIRVLDQVVFS